MSQFRKQFVAAVAALGMAFSAGAAVANENVHQETAQAATTLPVLEAGTCGPAAQINGALAERGQIILAAMNRAELDFEQREGVRTAQYVTSSSDFSRWYVVKGDAPLGTDSSEFCISITGTGMELNDYREDREPTVTRYEFDIAAARENCDSFDAPCNERSHVLDFADNEWNQRIAFQGMTDGETLWTLIADPQNTNEFRTLMTVPVGSTLVSGGGESFRVAPAVTDYLDRQQIAD